MSNDQPDINADAGDPTDGKKKGEWKTRYPIEARKLYYWEGCYLFFCSLFLLLSFLQHG